MAQTSVEWLVKQINGQSFNKVIIDIPKELIEQAQKMHKEETLRFVRTMPRETGVTQEGESYVQYDAEAHYNNTYNKM